MKKKKIKCRNKIRDLEEEKIREEINLSGSELFVFGGSPKTSSFSDPCETLNPKDTVITFMARVYISICYKF